MLRKPQLPRPWRKKGESPSESAATATVDDDDGTLATTEEVAVTSNAWHVLTTDTVGQAPETNPVPGRTHQYTLDKVYGPDTNTQELYQRSVKDLVLAAMEGYHASVLAYGQTSTGKTHTMSGTPSEPGLIPLCVNECFAYLHHRPAAPPREYLIRVSYLEVYKEHVRDLLAPPTSNTTTATPIRLFESPLGGGLIIRGLREEVVTTPAQVFSILALGESRRQVGATHLNHHSSRSHVMVRLCIESREAATSYHRSNSGDSNAGVRVSTLCLVDLAGSESVRLTGSADRRQEGHYINKSLMTLGQVVYALSEQQQQREKNPAQVTINAAHIPYRDSKLTRLLQPSLSGQAQVVILCCISPLPSHVEESHNTFKFATRAKRIPQKATIQESKDDKTLLQSYRDEIEELRQQLREAEEQKQLLLLQSPVAAAPDEVVTDEEIAELVQSIQTMEKLILKSNSASLPPTPGTPQAPFLNGNPEDWFDSDDAMDDDGDENDENCLLALAEPGGAVAATPLTTTPARTLTPGDDSVATTAATTNTWGYERDLQVELVRVQGLLHSVLKKKRERGHRKNGYSDENDLEVRKLRAQLEQQEAATTLRQADSSFLQAQLEEKDNLLSEVSKILEAMEVQHIKLERENAALRRKLAAFEGHGTGTSDIMKTARVDL
jgi:centromeric protein E